MKVIILKNNIKSNNDIEAYYDTRSDFALYPYAEDWGNVVKKFGDGIDSLLKDLYPTKSPAEISFYDCTCGIGTQAIGLAEHGYKVVASDLSSGMLRKAMFYSQQRNLNISYFQQDLRKPFPEKYHGQFDVVSSLNNSLIFISNDDETCNPLVKAFRNLNSVCRKNGFLMISLRPYDEYWAQRVLSPPGRSPHFREVGGLFVRFKQSYEWLNEKFYECTTSYEIKPSMESNKVDLHQEKVKVRAWRKSEVEESMSQAGWVLQKTFVYEESDTHYRERYFIARKDSNL